MPLLAAPAAMCPVVGGRAGQPARTCSACPPAQGAGHKCVVRDPRRRAWRRQLQCGAPARHALEDHPVLPHRSVRCGGARRIPVHDQAAQDTPCFTSHLWPRLLPFSVAASGPTSRARCALRLPLHEAVLAHWGFLLSLVASSACHLLRVSKATPHCSFHRWNQLAWL